VRISAAQPPWFKRAVFRLADWAVIDRHLQRPLNAFRATLGLAPVDRVLHRWVHSPRCVIGFFPAWFAAPQPDWPPHTHLVGFPLWDGGGDAPLPAAAADFFGAGAPPILITPGSAAAAASRFFRESVAAAGRLGRRAALVTNHPQQLPRVLPPHVASFGYLPFSEVLPHCALLVHHGGIGTLAQAIRAGIPHLVVPCSHDQFDNAWRIDRLGLGRRIAQTRYRAAGAAAAIHALLADGAVRARCRDFAARVDGDSAVRDACGLLEELAMPATASNAVRRG
jgi:UDP:flavonoid glycosyltransferase YjiC (YdhE family)